MISVDKPAIIKIRGNCSSVILRLLIAKALPKGINIKPPTERMAVAAKPMRYSFLLIVCIKCCNGLFSF